VALLALAPAATAHAQANLQLWGNLTLDWVRSERLVFELDVEPKVLVAAGEGEPGWRNLDLTPNAEYSPRAWLDLVAETVVGFTRQTDDVNSWEVSPRVGARFHLFARDVPVRRFSREHRSARRIVVRDLARIEARNFFYTGAGSGSDSSVRLRNRLEFLVPINRQRLSDDGATYFQTDWEWFVPLGDPDERFANRQRIRAGFGHRRSHAWRYEVLYFWTRSRNTFEDDFSTTDNTIDIRVKRVF
jgi:hypothetical protein